MMRDFIAQLEDIKRNPVQLYKLITLDLTAARSEVSFPVAGNYLMLVDGTDINVNIQVRFNLGSADAITLKKRQGVKIPFYSLFISNPAQAAKSVTIAYGVSESPLEFIDQSALVDVSTVGSITTPVDVSDRSTRRIGSFYFYNSQALRRYSVRAVNQAAGVILVDTGVLPVGKHGITLIVGASGSYGPANWSLQHRDAANAATIIDYPLSAGSVNGSAPVSYYEFPCTIATNERLRIEVLGGGIGADMVAVALLVHYQGS